MKVLKIDLYHAKVFYSFDLTEFLADMLEMSGEDYSKDLDENTHGIMIPFTLQKSSALYDPTKGTEHVAVYFGSRENWVIAHECAHAAWEVLKSCDVKVNYTNQEPLCYTLAYMVHHIRADDD